MGDQEVSRYEDFMGEIQQRVQQIGKDLHEINLELKNARSTNAQHAIQENMSRKTQKELERKELLRAKTTLRFMTLTAEEISAGAFLEGEQGQRSQPFNKILAELREQSRPEDQFIYDEVKKLIDQINNVSDEKQNMYCTDSANPKVMLEIGETPVASCQNYDGGSMNECLFDYSEADTKILVVRNERGNIVARSIFRLLAGSKNIPVLHVERIYSAITSNAIPRVVYTHALNKAREMGIPVVISGKAQTESGNMEEARAARGFSLAAVDYTIESTNARAPQVYVDSAGGRTDGEYELEGLLEIKQA